MWRLRSDLTACVASGRLILLDESADRYFALSLDQAVPVLDWLRARDGRAAPEALGRLFNEVQEDQLSNCAETTVRFPPPAPNADARAQFSIVTIVSVGIAVTRTWLTLRSSRLCSILNRHRKIRQSRPDKCRIELRQQSLAFAAARRWWPIKSSCLLDSLAADRWLGSPGNAQLVFGVSAEPFEAHCWLQTECDVLTDSYDRVSSFEPILAI